MTANIYQKSDEANALLQYSTVSVSQPKVLNSWKNGKRGK